MNILFSYRYTWIYLSCKSNLEKYFAIYNLLKILSIYGKRYESTIVFLFNNLYFMQSLRQLSFFFANRMGALYKLSEGLI